MKPIMLQGHERAVTMIKYNREGDLLFSCSKGHVTNVWYSLNGERLGSYNGHKGTIWCLDVNWDSTNLITGSADNTCRLWDIETGVQIAELETKSPVRTCGYSYGGNLIMYSTDKAMGQESQLLIYDKRDSYQIENNSPSIVFPLDKSKITSCVWGPLEETIIAGLDSGAICQWDIKNTSLAICEEGYHNRSITDLQVSKDKTMFITASKDTTAKLFDSYSLELKKTYKTDRPLNSASISPLLPHVVLGGGQEAMEVTTTDTKVGKFDARFYHMIFEDEFARVKGHFGPINYLDFHPNGKGYSSGGEDGYVRCHTFDPSYFDFEIEY